MISLNFRRMCAAAVPLVLAGCASVMDGDREQQLEVHTILDHREVSGVGCVLANDAGRWFVVAPGRVTVARSKNPLTIDCARQGAGSAREQVTSRFEIGKLVGNVVVTAGLGYYIDRRTGAGFDYPPTLTVLMHEPPAAPVASGPAPGPDATLF